MGCGIGAMFRDPTCLRQCLRRSCRCRDRFRGQCWFRRRRLRGLACLLRRETWRANRFRRCWVARPWFPAAWKSQRQHWRHCRRCLREPGQSRRRVVSQDRYLCGPCPSRSFRSLHPQRAVGERCYWRAKCRQWLRRHRRCCPCRHPLPRAREEAELRSGRQSSAQTKRTRSG